MYLPGQIIYDLSTQQPFQMSGDVWDTAAYPKRHTHFIKHSGKWNKEGDLYKVFTPKSLEEARDLLAKGIIGPGLANTTTHCWKCHNWYSNCASFKKCSEWETSRKHREADIKASKGRRRNRIKAAL